MTQQNTMLYIYIYYDIQKHVVIVLLQEMSLQPVYAADKQNPADALMNIGLKTHSNSWIGFGIPYDYLNK